MYDRIHVGVSLRRVPPALIDQTERGGILVTRWGTGYGQHDALVRLVVDADGTARGYVTAVEECETARGQQDRLPTHATYRAHHAHSARCARPTHDHVGHEFLNPHGAAQFAIGLRVPEVVSRWGTGRRPHTLWLYSKSGTDSYAVASISADGTVEARQFGPRQLWSEVARAYTWWHDNQCPSPREFGLTVLPTGEHRAWLRSRVHDWPVGL
jgi:hypothetical protein